MQRTNLQSPSCVQHSALSKQVAHLAALGPKTWRPAAVNPHFSHSCPTPLPKRAHSHIAAGGDRSFDIKEWTQSEFYRKILQGLAYTFNLSLVDAGYSGDWSRIGALSPETELFLQKVCVVFFALHVMASVGTAYLNISRNKPWLLPSTFTLGIGGLSVLQQYYEDNEASSIKLTPVVIIAVLVGARVFGQAILKSLAFIST